MGKLLRLPPDLKTVTSHQKERETAKNTRHELCSMVLTLFVMLILLVVIISATAPSPPVENATAIGKEVVRK